MICVRRPAPSRVKVVWWPAGSIVAVSRPGGVVGVAVRDRAVGEQLLARDGAAEAVLLAALGRVSIGRRGVQIFVIAVLGPQRAVIGGGLAAVRVAGENDAAERVGVRGAAGPGA